MYSSIKPAGKPRYRAGLALLLTVFMSGAGFGTPAQTKPKAKVHTVVIEAMRYSPPMLEVNPGDSVIWKNKDPFPHTATAEDGSFDSGKIAENRSWKFTAKKRGEFPYICTLHPTMKAGLRVK